MAGIQIGQLLVEQGVLTDAQVRHVLAVQKMSHRPFGDPLFLEQLLDDRRYGTWLKAGGPRQVCARDGLPGPDDLENDIAIDVALTFA